MSETSPVSTPAEQRPKLPSIAVQAFENIFAALRTGGALLMGNSALIYFGVVGKPDAFAKVLSLGVALFVVFSVPVAIIERNNDARRQKAKLVESAPTKGN